MRQKHASLYLLKSGHPARVVYHRIPDFWRCRWHECIPYDECAGASFESNPFARKLYLYAGAEYLIAAKIWLAVILLTAVYLIYRRNKGMYWTINGFLLALIIGGSMAALANIHAATGISYYIDGVIFSYLVMVGVFMGAGCVLDRFYAKDTGYGYARIKENLIGLKVKI